MKYLLILFVTLLGVLNVSAQQQIRVFLGDKEINARSVHYLDPVKIDSIKFYPGSTAQKQGFPTVFGDSVFVITMHDRNGLLTYDQVLDMYNVDQDARKFAITSGYEGGHRPDTIAHAGTMLFHKARLAGINIQKIPLPDIKPNPLIVIMHQYNRVYGSQAGRMLHWLQGAVEGLGSNGHYKLYKP